MSLDFGRVGIMNLELLSWRLESNRRSMCTYTEMDHFAVLLSSHQVDESDRIAKRPRKGVFSTHSGYQPHRLMESSPLATLGRSEFEAGVLYSRGVVS